MANKWRAQVVCCMLIFVFAHICVSQEAPQFSQRIEWRTDGNALSFTVEVQKANGTPVLTEETEKTFLELSLSPGTYRYRVTAFDFLGRKSSESAWTSFEVLKASQPEIKRVQTEVEAAERGEPLRLPVSIEGISEGSRVELISESIEGSLDLAHTSGGIGGSETESVSSVSFENVPPGKWRLKITNPSGLSAESDVIVVKEKDREPQVVYVREEVPVEVVVEVPVEKEEPPPEDEPPVEDNSAPEDLQEEEPPVAQEPLEEEPEPLSEDTNEEEVQPVEERPPEPVKPPKVKKEKKVRPPYVSKDIFLFPTAGLRFIPYDGTLLSYSDSGVIPTFGGRFSWIPKKGRAHQWGIEFMADYSSLTSTTDYSRIGLGLLNIQAGALWRHRLLRDNLFFTARLALGLESIQKTVSYSGEDAREARENTSFTYPEVSAGIGIMLLPQTFIVLQAGLDFTHAFIPAMQTGYIVPYIGIGLRL